MPISPNLNIRVAHILLSQRLHQKQVLAALHTIAPALASVSALEFDPEFYTGDRLLNFDNTAFRHKGTAEWDKHWRYKSLCIIDAGDRPPIGWEYESVHGHKRPVLIAECRHPHDDVLFTLEDRRLLRRSYCGRDHALYRAQTLEVAQGFNYATFIAVVQKPLPPKPH